MTWDRSTLPDSGRYRNLVPTLAALRSTIFDFLDKHGNTAIINAASTFVIRTLAAVLAFGLQVMLARYLQPNEYGKYVTFFTWLVIAGPVVALGFAESCVRFLPRYAHRGQKTNIIGFLRTGLTAAMIGAVVTAVAGLAALYLLHDQVSPAYLAVLIVFFVSLPIVSLEAYLEGICRSFKWFRLALVPAYVMRPPLIAAFVLLAFQQEQELTAAFTLGIFATVTLIAALVQMLVVRGRIRRLFSTVSSMRMRPVWIKASLPLALLIGMDELFNWSDILILSLMVSPEEVSVYFAAQRSMALAAFVQFAFMIVAAPQFAGVNATGNKESLQQSVSTASRWTFWLTVPAVLLTIAVGYPLLSLFGSAFVAGYSTMLVLGVAFILRASIGQAQDMLIVLGHQRSALVLLLASLLLNVALAIMLVPPLGPIGAAVSLALTHLVRAIVVTIVVYRLTGVWVLADFVGLMRAKPEKPVETA